MTVPLVLINERHQTPVVVTFHQANKSMWGGGGGGGKEEFRFERARTPKEKIM